MNIKRTILYILYFGSKEVAPLSTMAWLLIILLVYRFGEVISLFFQ